MRLVRRLLVTLLLLALPAAGAPPGHAAPEGQLTWAVHFALAPTWFDPAETSGIITPFVVLYALHDAMVKPLPGHPMAPSLAESWSASPDWVVYEFVLRKGVRFHNGEPVTAEDVKFSLERYRGASHKMLRDGVLDRAEEVRREGRRGRVQEGADRRRAVSVRVVHARRRAGSGGVRPVLAQDAEREVPGLPGHSGRHHAAGRAQAG